jgi:hypothetical protein
MDTLTKPGHCNICKDKIGSGDTDCNSHWGLLPHLWNQNQEYHEYNHFLVNKKRQQQNLPALEFNYKKNKQFSND